MMTALQWNERLALKDPLIDRTHQEFVALLQQLEGSLQQGAFDVAAQLAQLLEHTHAHFAMEERWMAATGFGPDNCHARQHQMVLAVLREVHQHAAAQGNLEPARLMLPELFGWFEAHAQMMDAALIEHVQANGYDTATEAFAPNAAPVTAPASSCGVAACAE
jgi:hemerythrin